MSDAPPPDSGGALCVPDQRKLQVKTYPTVAALCLAIALLFCDIPSASASSDDLTSGELREQIGMRAAGEYAEALTTFAEAMRARQTCPVPGSTFIDSWGAPRVGHVHQGVDMMAAPNATVYAPATGTLRSTSESFYLTATDGTEYFGTHNFGSLHPDGPVTVGTPIALVGNTGNAAGGQTHLHFEIHPGGGDAVNPYPSVAQWCSATPAAMPEIGSGYTFPYDVGEVVRWLRANRAGIHYGRAEVHAIRRFWNATVVNALRRMVAAQAIPYEANWDRVAACESGGNWSTSTGNGYYGGVQFSLPTWQSVGGQGYPHQNSKAEQIRRAEILRLRSGLGQWPVCGSRWYG